MSRLKHLKKLDQEILLDLSSEDAHGVELKIDENYYAIYEDCTLNVYSRNPTPKLYRSIHLHKKATHVFCQLVVDKITNIEKMQILKDGPEFIFLTYLYKRMKFKPQFIKKMDKVKKLRRLPKNINPDWFFNISGVDGKLFSATFFEKERINSKGEPELYLSLEAYSYHYATNLSLFRDEIENLINDFNKKQKQLKLEQEQQALNKEKPSSLKNKKTIKQTSVAAW